MNFTRELSLDIKICILYITRLLRNSTYKGEEEGRKGADFYLWTLIHRLFLAAQELRSCLARTHTHARRNSHNRSDPNLNLSLRDKQSIRGEGASQLPRVKPQGPGRRGEGGRGVTATSKVSD